MSPYDPTELELKNCDLTAVLNRLSKELAKRNEAAALKLAGRFLGPQCPNDAADIMTVILGRGLEMAELIPPTGRPSLAILSKPCVVGEYPQILDSEPCVVIGDFSP